MLCTVIYRSITRCLTLTFGLYFILYFPFSVPAIQKVQTHVVFFLIVLTRILSVLLTSRQQQVEARGGAGIQAGPMRVLRSGCEEIALPPTAPVLACLRGKVKEARQD